MSGSEDGSKVAGSGPRFLCAIALAGAACGLFRLTETGRKILSGMSRDIKVVRERDPAAKNSLEVVMCYPGLHALWLHRLSHMLWRRNVPLIRA
jgi:hypothetical protein